MSDDRRWILFDIGGVIELVDDDSWPTQWHADWAARLGISVSELRARIGAAQLPQIDVMDGDGDEYWSGLAKALGVGDETKAEIRADFWDRYCGEGNTEILNYAKSLRTRAGVAILSNSVAGAREEEERRFELSRIFDPICYSHEQGVNKPNRRAYEMALERMGTTADRVFFLDDHQKCVDAALAVGMTAILHRTNAATMTAIEEFLAC